MSNHVFSAISILKFRNFILKRLQTFYKLSIDSLMELNYLIIQVLNFCCVGQM
jgi:hypothetical protein